MSLHNGFEKVSVSLRIGLEKKSVSLRNSLLRRLTDSFSSPLWRLTDTFSANLELKGENIKMFTICIMFRDVKSSIYQKNFKSDWVPLNKDNLWIFLNILVCGLNTSIELLLLFLSKD